VYRGDPLLLSRARVRPAVVAVAHRSFTTWTRHITTFLNDPHTRAQLHTDALPHAFAPISAPVYAAFSASGDWHRPALPWLGALLDRGVRALVFNGVHDFECSWLAGERTTRRLDWAGKAAFAQAEMREWMVDGRKAGKTRTHGPLTFTSVFEAGHMVRARRLRCEPELT
jgi:carboxypeptidase C (cathepsin A)